MKTKGQNRRQVLFFYYVIYIITTTCCYFNDNMRGENFSLGLLGFGIVWALMSMLEFDTDEEIYKEV